MASSASQGASEHSFEVSSAMASNASQGATEHSFDHQEHGHQFRMMEQDYASGSEADYSPVKADVDDKVHRREVALAKIDKLRKVREGMRSKALEDAKCRMTEVVRKIKKRGEEAQDHRGGETKQRVAYAGRPWPRRRPTHRCAVKAAAQADLRQAFLSGTMQMRKDAKHAFYRHLLEAKKRAQAAERTTKTNPEHSRGSDGGKGKGEVEGGAGGG